MNILSIFQESLCIINTDLKKGDDLLHLIAQQGAKSPLLKDVDEKTLYKIFKAREAQGSTGFGKGVALPHARVPGINDFVLFLITAPSGVKWDAADGKKVKLFFVVIGPQDQPKQYLKVLAVVSRANASRDLYKALLKTKDPQELKRLFVEHTKTGEPEKSASAAPSVTGTAMKLLIVILYGEESLNDILEYFIQEGIEGANITDSWGMGHYVSAIPLFMDFLGFMDEESNLSKTIMTMVPSDKIERVVQGIEEITGDLSQENRAMIMTLPVEIHRGAMKML